MTTYPPCAYCGVQIRKNGGFPCPAELPPECGAYAKAHEAFGDPDVPETALHVSNLERPIETSAVRGARARPLD